MPKQQRMIRNQQQSQEAAMTALQSASDEDLEAETRYKAVAQAILGQRAAEKQDAKKARAHFQRAIAAAPPQQRMMIRRSADAALAFAERRPDDLKKAHERLGVEAPTGGQMFMLRVLSFIAPHNATLIQKLRGGAVVVLAIVAVLAIAFGIVSGISAAAGGLSLDLRIFYSLVLIVLLAVGVFFFGRYRRRQAEAKRAEALGTNRS
jgi:hypothetical protein